MTEVVSPAGRTAVVVLSGGLDSTTLAYHLRSEHYDIHTVSFHYGQRHERELDFAIAAARRLDVPHDLVDLRPVGRLLTGSALTDRRVEVPDGHYTDRSMRTTVVPNRNAILLHVAVGLAVARGAQAVAFGAHSGDHAIYPDCRPEFVESLTRSVRIGNEGFIAEGFAILAPFLGWDKAQIVRRGAALGVPWEETWSCYRGEQVHCGTCGTCTERRESFAHAGVTDPTVYEAGR